MASLKPHFSLTTRAGDLVFVSGQLPFGAGDKIVDGGIEAQTRQCIQNLATALASAELGLEHVVKVNVWLTEASEFPAFNRVYAEHFPGSPPARTTVGASLMVAGARIEIDAQAYGPRGR